MFIRWQDILTAFGWIAAIAAGIKGIEYLWAASPLGRTDQRLAKHDEFLATDKRHLEALDVRMDKMEQAIAEDREEHKRDTAKINDSLDTLGLAIASVINHMIDGNGIDELKEERANLLEYFTKH